MTLLTVQFYNHTLTINPMEEGTRTPSPVRSRSAIPAVGSVTPGGVPPLTLRHLAIMRSESPIEIDGIVEGSVTPVRSVRADSIHTGFITVAAATELCRKQILERGISTVSAHTKEGDFHRPVNLIDYKIILFSKHRALSPDETINAATKDTVEARLVPNEMVKRMIVLSKTPSGRSSPISPLALGKQVEIAVAFYDKLVTFKVPVKETLTGRDTFNGADMIDALTRKILTDVHSVGGTGPTETTRRAVNLTDFKLVVSRGLIVIEPDSIIGVSTAPLVAKLVPAVPADRVRFGLRSPLASARERADSGMASPVGFTPRVLPENVEVPSAVVPSAVVAAAVVAATGSTTSASGV